MRLLRCHLLFLVLVAPCVQSAQAPEQVILLDAPQSLVVRNRYAPGAESSVHTHRWPRTLYILEGGLLELTGRDGATKKIELAKGQTLSRPPETHKVRNIGDTTVELVETEAKSTQPVNYELIDGRWFNGNEFVARDTIYSVDGVFSAERPDRVDEIIDLSRLYLLPPFADAHAHHFDNSGIFSTINANYLKAGVFYGVSMTNSIHARKGVGVLVNQPDTIDVAYADAGVTATFGHPIMVYETLARNSYNFDKSAVEYALMPQAENDAYIIVDNEDDLERRWPQVLASTPDIVKIYLMYSEDYAERRDKPDTYGDRGLNPELVPAIVTRAHEDGLRVAAHVETANDFRVAVSAGVDVIAHLPGYSPDKDIPLSRYTLNEADAKRAADKGSVVIPIPLASAASRYSESDPDFMKVVSALHKRNIETLSSAGVLMAIGSDSYFSTPVNEVFLLHGLGIFSNAELLKMWTETTAITAFPTRKIGQIESGYEASFIGLRTNPISNFEAVKDVAFVFKQGQPLSQNAVGLQ